MSGGNEVNDITSQYWKNMNGLPIHFTNEGVYEGEYHALTCIRKSLEDDDRKERNRLINVLAPIAGMWFILCSPKIHEACQKQDYPGRIMGGGGDLEGNTKPRIFHPPVGILESV